MKNGNWIPLDKNLARYLPKDRPFSELEAAFSLSLDHDNNNLVTVSGYAACWGWSRKRIKTFLDKLGIIIKYPQSTRIKKNQKGHIALHKGNIKGTYKGHIRMINSKDIKGAGNIKGTYKEHKGNIKGSTTSNPVNPKSLNLNPKQQPTLDFLTPDLQIILANCSESFLKFVFKQYPEKSIREALQIASKATSIDNFEAFLRQALKEGWKSKKPRKLNLAYSKRSAEKSSDQIKKRMTHKEVHQELMECNDFYAGLDVEEQTEYRSVYFPAPEPVETPKAASTALKSIFAGVAARDSEN